MSVRNDESGAGPVAQARDALDSGRPAVARDVLVEHVTHLADPEALRLLGEVLHGLDDLAGAGAAWFGTTARGPVVDEAIAAWRAAHDDDFEEMWRSLPDSVRHKPRTPRVAALRAKAFPGEERAVAPGAEPQTPQESEPEATQPLVEHDRTEPSPRPSAPSGPRLSAPSGPRPSAASGPRPPGPRPPARRPPEERHEATTSSLSEGGAGGIDAARVITWVLVVIFVFCAIIGAITILRWIVPGP